MHGFLHLLGYDHESDARRRDDGELEREILARLGVPDPYLTRERESQRGSSESDNAMPDTDAPSRSDSSSGAPLR